MVVNGSASIQLKVAEKPGVPSSVEERGLGRLEELLGLSSGQVRAWYKRLKLVQAAKELCKSWYKRLWYKRLKSDP